MPETLRPSVADGVGSLLVLVPWEMTEARRFPACPGKPPGERER
jgi:hypothetical protein